MAWPRMAAESRTDAHGEQRHQEDRHGDHGDDCAPVAQGIDQLLAIHDGDVARAHDSTAVTKMSSRSRR